MCSTTAGPRRCSTCWAGVPALALTKCSVVQQRLQGLSDGAVRRLYVSIESAVSTIADAWQARLNYAALGTAWAGTPAQHVEHVRGPVVASQRQKVELTWTSK